MFLLLSAAGTTFAGSATWDLNPGSGDWNTATNWTPAIVPNGTADTATFGSSNTTSVSISANTEVNGITFTAAATSPYTITARSGVLVSLSGAGITNNSGTTQNFVAAPSGSGNALTFLFKNSAAAGAGTFFTTSGGTVSEPTPGGISFNDTSSADHGTFINNGPTAPGTLTFGGGATLFNNSATAANGNFINNGGRVVTQFGGDQGLTNFNDTATAANAFFTNNAATVSGAHGGTTAFTGNATGANGIFSNNGAIVSGAGSGFNSGSGIIRFFNTSTAGNGTFTNNASTASGSGGGYLEFHDTATAGNGTFNNDGATVNGAGGGLTQFYDRSTAGSATLIANGGISGGQGGTILFGDKSSGGTSRIEVFGNGGLDISFHNAPGVTVGSIEGDGNVFLGANNLTVGTSNIGTTFSGVIQDGGQNGGTGGSLTKIGTGTLDLTGTNTYTGNTNINRGVLKVDGSITSNTFVDHGGTLAGTGTVQGDVTNNGVVSPGDAPGTLTVNGNYIQNSRGSLLIDIAGTSAGEFSVLDVLGNAKLSGVLDPVLLNGFVPAVGESFTFLDYASLTGKLFVFDRNIDNAAEHWKVTYNPTNAILTVAPGNVPLPDTESTLLLLTLSLLGLGGTAIKCRTIR